MSGLTVGGTWIYPFQIPNRVVSQLHKVGIKGLHKGKHKKIQ